MASPKNTGFKRIYNAFFYSVAGLASAWNQIGLLILTIFIVLIVELLNSAVEAAINRISDEQHPLSKQAKDIASAAVFISLVLFTVIWGLVLFERFYSA